MLTLSKNRISSFDGDIVSLRATSDSEQLNYQIENVEIAEIRDYGKGRYLVRLKKAGQTIITVTAGKETAVCKVYVQEAAVSNPNGKFKVYVGDTHAHTSYSDGMATPGEVFNKVKEEDYFDFFTVSDHTLPPNETSDENFFKTFEAAEKYTAEDFIAFAGSESGMKIPFNDSMGNPRENGGEIVTINADGYASAKGWDDYFEKIGNNKSAFAIIAHPQIQSYSIPSILNSFDPEHATTPRTLELIHGVETLNERDSSNMVNERTYSLFLDCGYKVAPIGASDHHGPRWGKIAEHCRTFVYSEGHSKDYFIDALRNARAYSCENGNVKLFYTVNGQNPATTLPLTDTYHFHITAEPFYVRRDDDDTDYVEVISDHGIVVASREVGRFEFTFDITVKSETARYFYLKLYSKIGDITWSAPIFTGRPYDVYPKKPFTKTALNDGSFKLKAWSGGIKRGDILSKNANEYLQLEHPDGELIIDMGEIRNVSAVGYFPMLPRRKCNEDYATFLSCYEYYLSVDGIEYNKVAEGRILLYGSEHIAEFPTTEARYLKLRSVSTVGSEMRNDIYKKLGVTIGSLRVY